MRYAVRFVLFWYDFLVGDCWELAAGVVVALVAAGVTVRYSVGLAGSLGPALALVVVGLLVASLWLEWSRRTVDAARQGTAPVGEDPVTSRRVGSAALGGRTSGAPESGPALDSVNEFGRGKE